MGEPSLTIISLIARMRQPSCPTNPIISIIPFLGFQIRKKNPFYFLISSFFKLRKNSQSPNLPFILSRFNSSFDQRNLDRRGDLFHRPWTTSRPRRGSFSSFSHPARGYDALRILEGRGRSSSATEERTRRKGEARSQSGEGGQATTSSTNLDGARVQVGSTGW